jgi:hypothetical protein
MVGSTVHAQFGTDNFDSGLGARIESKDGIVFKGAGSTERMRIDSSGRLYVGTTNTAPAINNVAGFVTINGTVQSSVSGGISGYFNRMSTDGDIVQFRKDGATVGSIGTSGDLLYMSSASGAGFRLVNDDLRPATGSSNADNTYDLGNSNARWRDLHLSGGVYLGGTGAANKLDDYEEGTWTLGTNTGVTLTASSTASGRYTKIGNLVRVSFLVTPSAVTSSSTYFDITGLPFAAASDGDANAVGSVMSQYTLPKESQLVAYIAYTNSSVRFYECDTGAWQRLQHSDFSASSDLYVNITYETDS